MNDYDCIIRRSGDVKQAIKPEAFAEAGNGNPRGWQSNPGFIFMVDFIDKFRKEHDNVKTQK